MLNIVAITALAALLPFTSAQASGSGKTTRYWDCCKPSCAWSGKGDVTAPVTTCDIDNNPLKDANAASGCSGGDAYMCADQSPWQVDEDTAYGYAAVNIAGDTESGWCCSCYELTFTSGAIAGKKMVVQATNTGGDLGSNQFDLAIPGGGVGIFNGCTQQYGAPANGWGAQYGGISDASQCSTFAPAIKSGCDFRFDWFDGTDNPTVDFKQVTCPAALTDKTGCVRSGETPTGPKSVKSAPPASSAAKSSTAAPASSSIASAATSASTTAVTSVSSSADSTVASSAKDTASASSASPTGSSVSEAGPTTISSASSTAIEPSESDCEPDETSTASAGMAASSAAPIGTAPSSAAPIGTAPWSAAPTGTAPASSIAAPAPSQGSDVSPAQASSTSQHSHAPAATGAHGWNTTTPSVPTTTATSADSPIGGSTSSPDGGRGSESPVGETCSLDVSTVTVTITASTVTVTASPVARTGLASISAAQSSLAEAAVTTSAAAAQTSSTAPVPVATTTGQADGNKSGAETQDATNHSNDDGAGAAADEGDKDCEEE